MKSFDIASTKGDIGEMIIKDFLVKEGLTVYTIEDQNKPHSHDMFACDYSADTFFALDVKTKARLNKYNATGINESHYRKYLKIKNDHNMPFFIYFVDEKMGDIHRFDLNEETPGFIIKDGMPPYGNIICWELQYMEFLQKLSKEQMAALSKFDQRNHTFNPDGKLSNSIIASAWEKVKNHAKRR